jgi:hypothetical protein
MQDGVIHELLGSRVRCGTQRGEREVVLLLVERGRNHVHRSRTGERRPQRGQVAGIGVQDGADPFRLQSFGAGPAVGDRGDVDAPTQQLAQQGAPGRAGAADDRDLTAHEETSLPGRLHWGGTADHDRATTPVVHLLSPYARADQGVNFCVE